MSPDRESPDADDQRTFGFDGDGWIDHAQAALRPEPPGTLGDYEIVGEVHRGGQGVVYRAVQPGTNRPVAIKRLLAGVFASPAALRRFEREVEAAAALRHPGIVTVYGMEIVDGCPIMAMEWVEGAPVSEWARPSNAPPRDVRDVLRTFLRICTAVEHAHQHGILHRDLKPSNILIDGDGRPRVLDFGLAKALRDDPSRTNATLSGGFIGTPAYASPEHMEGSTSQLDVRSDVYSLGVVLYEMLTGTRPYDPDSGLRAYLDALDREAYAAPSSLRRGLGREVDAVVRRALAPRREDRYGSVGEFAADVRRLLAGEPVSAVQPSAAYEFRKLVSRHRSVFALSCALLVGSLLFAWHSFRQSRDLERQRDAAKSQEQKTVALLDFLVFDMLLNVQPAEVGKDVSVGELLSIATDRVSERFADQPDLDARVRFYLARTYENLGDYQRAVALFESALERIDVAPNATDFDRGNCEQSLARLLRQVERTDESEAMFRSVERRLLAAPTVDYERLSQVLVGLAGCATDRGDMEQMLACNERGLAIVLEHLPDDFEERYAHQHGMALAHARLGDLELARTEYETLLREVEEKFGAGDKRAGDLLGRISDIFEAQLRFDEAKAASRRSLELFVQAYGNDHPSVASALGDLASLMTSKEEAAEAESMLRRAIDITERARGKGTIVGLVHETRLAQNLARQGRFDEAIPVLRDAAERFEAKFGAESVWALRARRSLAQALAASNEFEEAVEHWKRAKLAAPADPAAAESNFIECQQGLIRALRGAGLREEAREAHAEYLARILTDDQAPEAAIREESRILIDDYRSAGDEPAAKEWEATLEQWIREHAKDD